MRVNNPLDKCLTRQGRKYIDIKETVRAEYGKHFETLHTTIFRIIKEDPTLAYLIVDFNLEGSSGDMLKIAKPNEFDLVFKLGIPHSREIIVTRDSGMPGNVLLNMTRVLQLLENDRGVDQQNIHRLLNSLVNAQNFLVVEKMQSWLQSRFRRALNRLKHSIVVDGKASRLKYRICGPAHTVEVEGMEYSVDFVPAIRLDAEQNVFRSEQLIYFENIPYWDAIPKPFKNPLITESISFRSSHYKAEQAVLKGKHENCRNAIKYIKKFRDVKTNLHNLKSYFIKTLFLWKIRSEPEAYWHKPLTVILIDMFDELSECLCHGRLDFFWDPKLNMLDIYTTEQKLEMFRCVEGMPGKLRSAARDPTYRRLLTVLQAFSHKDEAIDVPRYYSGKSYPKRLSNGSYISHLAIKYYTMDQTIEMFQQDKTKDTSCRSLLPVVLQALNQKECIAFAISYPRISYPKRNCVKRLTKSRPFMSFRLIICKKENYKLGVAGSLDV